MRGWTYANLRLPPLNVPVWCLVENPSDGEPYLIECVAEHDGAAVKLVEGWTWNPDQPEVPGINYLPPHHNLIAWRLK